MLQDYDGCVKIWLQLSLSERYCKGAADSLFAFYRDTAAHCIHKQSDNIKAQSGPICHFPAFSSKKLFKYLWQFIRRYPVSCILDRDLNTVGCIVGTYPDIPILPVVFNGIG